MKIAFINSVAGFGSTGRIVADLADMPGVSSRIYYGRKKDRTGKAVRFNGFFGNSVHAIATYACDAQGFCNAQQTENLIHDLEQFDPDLVHLHNLHGYYINVQILFDWLRKKNVPVIWTLHDCWSFTGHCAHYEMLGCAKWKTLCKDCPGLRKYPVTFNGSNVQKNWMTKRMIFTSLTDLTVVTPSRWLKDQVEQSFLKDIPVRVIPNGIDLSRFHPVESNFRKEHRLEHKRMLLAVASVWDKTKGLDDLVQIANRLNESSVLVVVGVTKKQMKLFDRNTICLERTENLEKLVELYSTADLFLNLTREDTFPTVNIEAMACGCPVLTYPTGGSPEMVEGCGLITRAKSVDAVLELLNCDIQPDRAKCVVHAQLYSGENMCKNYMALYEEVMKNKGRAI